MYLWTQTHCPQWGHNLRHLSRLRAPLTPGLQGLLAVSLATRLASVKPEKRVFLSVYPHLSAKASTSRHCTIVRTIVQIGVGYACAWESQQCSQLALINDFCMHKRKGKVMFNVCLCSFSITMTKATYQRRQALNFRTCLQSQMVSSWTHLIQQDHTSQSYQNSSTIWTKHWSIWAIGGHSFKPP